MYLKFFRLTINITSLYVTYNIQFSNLNICVTHLYRYIKMSNIYRIKQFKKKSNNELNELNVINKKYN